MTSETVPELLREQAALRPHRSFLRFSDHELSFAEVDAQTDGLALALSRLDVCEGQAVPSLLNNGPETVLLWFALNKLGAVHAPINTAFRGHGLAHVLNLVRSPLVVVDASLESTLLAVWDQLEVTPRVVVRVGTGSTDLGEVRRIDFEQLTLDGDHGQGLPAARSTVSSLDTSLLLFTSGTTGRSKACALPHRFAVRQAQLFADNMGLREDDVLFCPFPLFHADAAIFTLMPALHLGATAAFSLRFNTSTFWDDVRAFGATVFDYMGATLTLLARTPPGPEDTNHRVRLAWGVPLPRFASEFEERFAIQLTEVYGLTDVGIVLYNPLDEPRRPGSCGRPIPSFEVQILDEEGRVLPSGHVGEIAVRPNEPGLALSRYLGDSEATLDAFRGLWFHTGDLATMDADGFVYFVGRTKDVIRRFGENISAFEVEEVAKSHPQIADAAAFAVPSELSEDELMLAVVLAPGETVLTPAEIAEYFQGRIAAYAVPRFIEIFDDLPRTPTEKVEKHVLASRGVTDATWDKRGVQNSR